MLKNVRYVLELKCRLDKVVVTDKRLDVSSNLKKVVRVIIAIILLRSTWKKCGKTEIGCQFGCPCLTPKKRDSGANNLSWLYFFNFWSLAPCIHSDGLGHSLLIDKGYETSSLYYCIYFVYICYPFALYFSSKWIQI